MYVSRRSSCHIVMSLYKGGDIGDLKEKTEFSILLNVLKLEDVLEYDGGDADAFIESCDKRIIGAEKESSIFLKRDAPSFLS